MRRVVVSSVIPRGSVGFINEEIVTYFKKTHATTVQVDQLKATKIPNAVVSVRGDCANVYATYRKLTGYLNEGKFIDPGFQSLRKFYVRGLDKIFKPSFLIPQDLKTSWNLRDNDSVQKFKSRYKSCSILRFPQLAEPWPVELWRFDPSDVPAFLDHLLLNTANSAKFLEQRDGFKSSGLYALDDADLDTKTIKMTAQDLKRLLGQNVRFSHLTKNNLCEVVIDYDLLDSVASDNSEHDFITVTGPIDMTENVERFFQLVKYEFKR